MIFKNLRKYTKTIMWVIAIFIVPAFVIWNVGSAIRDRRSGYAGTIYGKKIPQSEFLLEKNAARNEIIMKYGENLNENIDLDEQTWTRLILLKEAEKRKITVSNAELFNYIKTLPAFRDVEMTIETYTYSIARVFQQNPKDFEIGIKHSLLIAKLIEQLTSGISANDDELKKAYAEENEQASVVYVALESENFIDLVKADNAEQIAAYYEKNKADFKKPEQVDVEYIAIKFEDFKTGIEIADDRVEKYYENNKNSFIIETAETDGQIQFQPFADVRDKIKEKLTEKEMTNKAMETARRIMSELYTNENFQAVAEKFSLKTQRTGPFSMLQEVPGVGLSFPFIKSAFALKAGEISEIVSTPTALYMIKLAKKIKPYVPEYAEVKEETLKAYKQAAAIELAAEKSAKTREEINALINQEKLSFEKACEKLGLSVKTADSFTRNGYVQELGFAADFAQAAFSLQPGQVSEAVQIPNGFSVLKLNSITPISEDKFLEEKENYRMKVLGKKRNDFLNAWFEAAKTEANPVSFLEKTDRAQ